MNWTQPYSSPQELSPGSVHPLHNYIQIHLEVHLTAVLSTELSLGGFHTWMAQVQRMITTTNVYCVFLYTGLSPMILLS